VHNRITGSKKQSDEGAPLFAVPVHAIVMAYFLVGHKNSSQQIPK
jgi:hypothetical protein